MKSLIISVLSIICLLVPVVFVNAQYSGCSSYGIMAYETYNGYCQCMSGYLMGKDWSGQPYCVSGDSYCRDKYGYGSEYDRSSSGCKCSSGYVWDTTFSGQTCVSCSSKYGSGATSDYSGGCKCRDGYLQTKDILGKVKCIDADTYCRDKYGFSSSYNSSDDSCVCDSGYIMTNNGCESGSHLCTEKYGSGSEYDTYTKKCLCSYNYVFIKNIFGDLECKTCFSIYGSYSSYDSLLKECKCNTGYVLDDKNQCVRKQNNVYFYLKELDTYNKSAIVKSNYDNKYYFIEYRFGCYDSSFRRYLRSNIVINLGTDFDLDVDDKIVLFDDNETCEIKSRMKVDSEFTFIKTELLNASSYSASNINSGKVLKKYAVFDGVYNVRNNSNTSAKVISKTKKNIKYEILGSTLGTWIKIKINTSTTGWVMKKFAKIN